MQDNRPNRIRWMLGGGVLVGCLMMAFFSVFMIAIPNAVNECLHAPARGLAWLWHYLGLPPQGEALALPFAAICVQWFVVGAFVGLWRCRKLQRQQNANSSLQ